MRNVQTLCHLGVCILIFVVCELTAKAQAPSFNTSGLNAVVHSPSGSVVPSPSYDLVDATQFSSSGDICQKIQSIFSSYNIGTINEGVVIDARGVTTLNCTSGINPWASLTGGFANIVLLPSGTITIAVPWVLPAQTQLIGEGPNSTIIKWNGSTPADMIDMGNELGVCPGNDCPGIVIEHLALNGNGVSPYSASVNGIVNCCSQEHSLVKDVLITQVQTGLRIYDKYSQNSGPYTGLTISNVNTCVVIAPGAGPGGALFLNSRGVHGLTCSNSTNTTAAITIDGPNNTLEDVSIIGSSGQDGILVGQNSTAQGNVFINIQGSGLANVIELGNQPTPSTSPNNCPNSTSGTSTTVCDISIFGVSSSTGGNTIKDDLTSTTVTDTTVAMYTLGEMVSNFSSGLQYSRLATATSMTGTGPHPPTWLVGTSGPTGACVIGSLYSCTSSTCPTGTGGILLSLWECKGGGVWKNIQ